LSFDLASFATVERSLQLTCHPHTPSTDVRGVAVRASWTADGALALSFSLDGEIARLRIPTPRPSGVGHELWRHTCFEAFVARQGVAGYVELNFSPSGEWATFAFSAYRELQPQPEVGPAPRIAVRRTGRRLELDAKVALADARATLRIGLAAVVEDASGTLSYWSLYHPPGRPDFHHRDAFVLELEPHARDR
jgi:hypothetical protein